MSDPMQDVQAANQAAAQQQCLFCGIAQGKVGSLTLYDDELVKVVMDIYPASKGHCLVIPKQHAPDLVAFETKLNMHSFEVARQLAVTLKHAFKAEGINILLSQGKIAGQTLDHLVVHVIPRYKDDGLALTWQPQQMDQDKLKADYEILMKAMNALQEGGAQQAPVQEQAQPVQAAPQQAAPPPPSPPPESAPVEEAIVEDDEDEPFYDTRLP